MGGSVKVVELTCHYRRKIATMRLLTIFLLFSVIAAVAVYGEEKPSWESDVSADDEHGRVKRDISDWWKNKVKEGKRKFKELSEKMKEKGKEIKEKTSKWADKMKEKIKGGWKASKAWVQKKGGEFKVTLGEYCNEYPKHCKRVKRMKTFAKEKAQKLNDWCKEHLSNKICK